MFEYFHCIAQCATSHQRELAEMSCSEYSKHCADALWDKFSCALQFTNVSEECATVEPMGIACTNVFGACPRVWVVQYALPFTVGVLAITTSALLLRYAWPRRP